MASKVHTRIKKGPDFELHVRTVREEGLEIVELRDYVPSEKWYGRGVQFSKAQIPEAIEALSSLARLIGGDADPSGRAAAQAAAANDPNQLRLF